MQTWIARALVIAVTALPAGALADEELALPFEPGHGQGLFLILSDIHFDPFADPAIVHELVEADVDAWPAIFKSAGQQDFVPYGSDTNYPLMTSALAAAARLLPQPDLVLYAGDHLAHHFETKFETYAGGGPEAYARFVIKTMAFVSEQLRGAFPQAPVYATLGNDDSICGDYMIAPAEEFLAAVGEDWAEHSAHPEAFADFGIGGFYAVPHPTIPDHDLIVLNDVFWSSSYDDRCNPAGGDPGAAELAWLEWTLYRTKLRGRTASVLSHIPPGINAFNAAHGTASCTDNVQPYLKDAYAAPFLALLEQYRDILQISYVGHTHRDDFRVVFTKAGASILLAHITPSISPIYQNNPGFGLVLYDRTSGDLLDYATVYLTNLGATAQGKPAKWAIEYTFKGAYGYTSYDPATAAGLARAIRDDATVRHDYITFVPVSTASTDPPIDQQNWLAYACAQTELSIEAFAASYCGE